jgi:hypothetical protein
VQRHFLFLQTSENSPRRRILTCGKAAQSFGTTISKSAFEDKQSEHREVSNFGSRLTLVFPARGPVLKWEVLDKHHEGPRGGGSGKMIRHPALTGEESHFVRCQKPPNCADRAGQLHVESVVLLKQMIVAENF